MRKKYSENSDKFKSVVVVVTYIMPYSQASFSKNALLAHMLTKSCKKYKTTRELELKKAMLMSTKIEVETEKYAHGLALKFIFESINGNCTNISNKKNLDEALELLYEIILNPNVEDYAFADDMVLREKNTAIQNIHEERDNKKKHALTKLEECMFIGEEYSKSILGNEDEIEKITSKELYKYYVDVINNATVLVETVGNLEGYHSLARDIYQKLNNSKELVEAEKEDVVINESVEFVEERQEINQSILTIGLKQTVDYEGDYVTPQLYAHILGGTPSSKLFQNVREKNSLAYFAKAMYNKSKNSIYMFAGISYDNYFKAKNVMEEQLYDMKNGDITDEEFEAAKTSLISSYKELADDKYDIARIVASNIILDSKYLYIEEIIEAINEITKKDIIEYAKHIKETNVFLLGGIVDG